MTTGKIIALTIRTVGKVMSLLFNMLSWYDNTLYDNSFSSKEKVSFNFMAVVAISSDFGA